MQVYMHVNYLEHVFSIEEICKRAADAGYDGVELRGWDNSGAGAPLQSYVKGVCGSAERAGLRLVLGCPNRAGHAELPERQQSMNDLKSIMRIGADYGVKILNVFADPLMDKSIPPLAFHRQGSALATEDYIHRVVEYFSQAGDIAARHGMRLCFETHGNYLHDLASPTLDLLRRIDHPHVQANLDMGNIALNDKNLGMHQEIELLGGRIGYVHLKNMQWTLRDGQVDLRGTPLSAGQINHWQLISLLIAAGYRGPWTIENIMQGDKRQWMTEDLSYLRNLLSEIVRRSGNVLAMTEQAKKSPSH